MALRSYRRSVHSKSLTLVDILPLDFLFFFVTSYIFQISKKMLYLWKSEIYLLARGKKLYIFTYLLSFYYKIVVILRTKISLWGFYVYETCLLFFSQGVKFFLLKVLWKSIWFLLLLFVFALAFLPKSLPPLMESSRWTFLWMRQDARLTHWLMVKR